MSLVLTVDGPPLARPPRGRRRAAARAGAGGEGQRLRPRAGPPRAPRPVARRARAQGRPRRDRHARRGDVRRAGQVRSRFDGDLLVLTPWRPFGPAVDVAAAGDRRVVHTVSRPEDLEALRATDPGARFVLERRTRHAAARADPRGAVGGRRERTRPRRGRRGRAPPAAGRGQPPARGAPPRRRRRRRRPGRPHRVGQPPHRGGAGDAARRSTPTSPSAPAPAPPCGSATAARCG